MCHSLATMQRTIATKTMPDYWWNTSYRLFTLLALLVGAIYLYTMGQVISNTPIIDGAIQSFFTILYWQDGNTFLEKITNTWWTYLQHRAIFLKIFNLALYAFSGSIDIYIVGIFANVVLVALVFLMAHNCWQHRTPSYSILISALFILTAYHWPTSIWPQCALGYFTPITLSYLTLVFLDLRNPRIIAACFSCWLSAFTMANGILTIVTGSIVLTLNIFLYQRYSRAQVALWLTNSLLCLITFLVTTDIFSTELLNAKSAHDIFYEAPSKIVGFLESLGAAPFMPHEYHTEKIALGTIILTTSIALLVSRASWKNPPAVGLLLFTTGTMFFMSIFRFSSGIYNGYQMFTTINYAALFLLASIHIKQRNWLIPFVLLTTATIFNLNALWLNFGAMIETQKKITNTLYEFLITGNPETDSWFDVILREAVDKNIYKPLQTHNTLPIASDIESINFCKKNTVMQGSLQTKTGEKSFAILANIKIQGLQFKKYPQVLLCNNTQSYLITLSETNIQQKPQELNLQILLDKRTFIPGEYQVQVKTESTLLTLPETLTMTSIAPWNRADKDCEAIKQDLFSRWKSTAPLVNHYCKQATRP